MESTFKRRNHEESNFELQITALIDTLVIILIFLLKSMATDTLDVEQSKGITMPMVFNGITTGVGSRLDVSAEAVSWNGTKFIEMKAFDVKKPVNGAEGWKGLDMAMNASVEKEKSENKFDGKLLLQADKKTPFPVLQEVLKVAKSHGYKDIRFVGAKYD
ncbi:MAG: ExbD/TolR family protein [Bdellovibrionota bacterium]